MDPYAVIVGKREVRVYDARPLARAELLRVLQAGRAAGSSRNRQPWRFVVVTERPRLLALARWVSRPSNLTGAPAAIAVAVLSTAGSAAFDAGRAAQNMMLAAWTLGIGSCPNTPTDQTALRQALGLPEDMLVPTVLSLGYPAPGQPRPRRRADPDRILARIDRLPLETLVHWETYRPG